MCFVLCLWSAHACYLVDIYQPRHRLEQSGQRHDPPCTQQHDISTPVDSNGREAGMERDTPHAVLGYALYCTVLGCAAYV